MDLTLDHKVLEGAQATRRYFAKFEGILHHLRSVVKLSESENLITKSESKILQMYLLGYLIRFRLCLINF